jgi:serine/threonine protein kinase
MDELQDCPNIIRMVDVNGKKMLSTGKYYYMFMELCSGGSLADYRDKFVRHSDEVISYIFKQLFTGLKELHTRNVSHSDLKTANIFIKFDSH